MEVHRAFTALRREREQTEVELELIVEPGDMPFSVRALRADLAALREDFAHFAPYFEAGARALCPDPTSERRRLDAARARHKEGT